MSQTTTPPNAPEVDVLAVIDRMRLQAMIGRAADSSTDNKELIGQIDEDRAAYTAVAALLTREAALVAELDAALRRANIAEARVKGWEATVVITNLPARVWPVEGWGPGEGETVAVPELTPKKLTDILDRLKAADAERDALAAEVGALREDAERYRWLRENWSYTVSDGPKEIDVGDGKTIYGCIETEVDGDEMDAAIDAARAEAGQG